MTRTYILLPAFLFSFLFCRAQHRDAIGEGAPGFSELRKDSLALDRMIPKQDGVVYYKSDGTKLFLTTGDTIVCNGLYQGTYLGRTETWVKFFGTIQHYNLAGKSCFVPLSDMLDVEKEHMAKVDDMALAASEADERQESVDEYITHVFRVSVIPAVVLLFVCLLVFHQFLGSVAEKFLELAASLRITFLAGLLLSPIVVFFFNDFNFATLQLRSGQMTWLYDRLGFDPDYLKQFTVDTLSFWPIAKFELEHFFLAMTLVFMTWIAFGCLVAMIIAFFTSGTGPSATGTSYDGGRTVYIHSVSPGSPGIDLDFDVVMKYYLIYSILAPLMYFTALGLFGTSSHTDTGRHAENWLRPLIVGGILTGVVSVAWRGIHKKGSTFTRWVGNLAMSFLGLAVLLVVLLALALGISWLIYLIK